MSEHDEHSSFIKTPQQLVTIVLLAFIVPVIGIVLLVKLVLSGPSVDPAAMTPAAVAQRIQPVGSVSFSAPAGSPAAPAAAPGALAKAGPPDGKKIYEGTCVACHGTGAAGAPKFGDKAAWAPRIATGMDTLLNVALHGKGAMPPKGGNASLSDADMRAAIEYMVSHSK
ncbi:MAG TPA: c-type cytochrome [Burkholderiales bacterium]|nr:c-type cytochrome [Burkholderiales bacterium]